MKKIASLGLGAIGTAMAQYDPGQATNFVYLSAAAYCNLPSFNCTPCASATSALGLDPSTLTWLTDSLTGNYGYVIGDDAGTAYIAYRGSDDIQNWIENLTFDKVPYAACANCEVHAGFYAATTVLASQVLNGLGSLGPSDIQMSGHSLGAAMSTLSFVDLAVAGYPVSNQINFGQPRVGNDVYSAFFTGNILGSTGSTGLAAGKLGLASGQLGRLDTAMMRGFLQALQAEAVAESEEVGSAKAAVKAVPPVQLLQKHVLPISAVLKKAIMKSLRRNAAVAAAAAGESGVISEERKAQLQRIEAALAEQVQLTVAASKLLLKHQKLERQLKSLPEDAPLAMKQRLQHMMIQLHVQAGALAAEVKRGKTSAAAGGAGVGAATTARRGLLSLGEEHLALLDEVTWQRKTEGTAAKGLRGGDKTAAAGAGSLYASAFSGASSNRVIHYADIVPHVPPESFGFEHAPQEVWYTEDQSSYTVCSASNGEDSSCADSLLLPDSVSDHLSYLSLPISGMC